MTVAAGPAASAFEAPTGALETFDSPRGTFDWRVVNDNVMGGRSLGGYDIEAGELKFTGATNTNGGGFSSLRTGPLKLDLSAHGGVELDLVGDGRQYTWRLTTQAVWRGRPIAYWARFDTQAGVAQTVRVPFGDFVPRFRGARLSGPPLDTARITGMGLMIYDGNDGPFEMSVSQIRAYPAPFSLAALRWSSRVLVLGAPSADDPALRAQLAAIAATQTAFAERDLVLILALESDDAPDGQRILTPEERRDLREQLALRDGRFGLRLIGKDGSVKRREDAPIDMIAVYDQVDGMPMRRREIRDRAPD